MKIRDKLFLGFGLYVFLAIVLGFSAYKGLSTITTRFKLVEMADDITNVLLEVRRYEKNFLFFKDKGSMNEIRKYLTILKKDIDNIRKEIIKEIGINNYVMMKRSITEYETLINRVAENVQSQEELVFSVRDVGREVEKGLSGNKLEKFLVLRRHEKNLMLYKDKETYKNFTTIGAPLHADIEVARYLSLVERLFALYRDEAESVDAMRSTARQIQSFTENLSRQERSDIDSIIKRSNSLFVFAIVVIILLGTVINFRLARSIAMPLRRLERITKKVADGDFSEGIEVSGNDEIASLAVSFNQMEDKLQDAMSSLEQAIQRLHEKQAQLVEAEKLASIGILAAGIAHEINNPLTSVLTFSNLLLEQCPVDDPRHERLKMMARETERARTIVRQLLSFAKETPLRRVKININQPVVEITDSLVAQGVFKEIELILNLSKKLPEIYVDPARIGQVVLNMILNATHAITPPGTVEVTTRAAGDFVEIVFCDTGSGIPAENISRIFDPFFTTKDVNKGTGLGLAVSYGIIKKHGGDIEVQSEAGKGTTFIVRLPVDNG